MFLYAHMHTLLDFLRNEILSADQNCLGTFGKATHGYYCGISCP